MQVIQQSVTGQLIKKPVVIDRRRRRLSAVVKKYADPTRPHIVAKLPLRLDINPADLRVTEETVRLAEEWSSTLVGGDDVVVICYLPLGGGGSGGGTGKQIGFLVATLALVALGQFYLAPALATAGNISAAAASFIVSTATAGVIAGAGYLLSRAMTTKDKKSKEATLYAVQGGGNLPRAGERIPRRFGHTWAKDVDLTQPDYVVNNGTNQVLYKRITLTLGHARVLTVKVGNATMWTEAEGLRPPFEGAQFEIIPPGGTSKLVPASVISNSDVSNIELARRGKNPPWSGPFQVNIPAAGGKIQLDYSVPQCYYNEQVGRDGKDGTRQRPGGWHVYYEYAKADANGNPSGPWTPLFSNLQTGVIITKGVRFSGFVELPAGSYLVRGQNFVLDLGQDSKGNDLQVNTVVWDGLRVQTNEVIVRPHVTEIAMVITATQQLGSVTFADVKVESIAKLEVWNGTTWELRETREAIHAYGEILRGVYGGIVAGANMPNSDIDLATLEYYDSALTTNNNFDGMIRGPVSIYEAAATVLGVIRAEPARLGNSWSLTRDEPRSVARRHVISRRAVIKGSTKTNFRIALSDGSADVIGEFNPDGDPERRREIRKTFGQRSDTPRRISLTGISDYNHAMSYLTWVAACAYYRRRRRSVTTELSGRLMQRNDGALVDAYFLVPDARIGGVIALSGNTVKTDTVMEIGANYYAIFRDRENKQWGPVRVTQGSDKYTIVCNAADVSSNNTFYGKTLTQVIAPEDETLTPVYVGPLEQTQDPFIIESAEPTKRDRVDVVAIEDNPAVWAALGEALPAQPPLPSRGDLDEIPLPRISWLRVTPLQKTSTLEADWAVGPTKNAAIVEVDLSYDNWATAEPVSRGIARGGSITIRYIPEDPVVNFRARAVDANGNPSPYIYASLTAFLPAINDQWVSLLVDIQNMTDQTRKDIRSLIDITTEELNAVLAGDLTFTGYEPARLALILLNQKLERLADLAGQRAEEEYTVRSSMKAEYRGTTNETKAAIEKEESVRAGETFALSQSVVKLTSDLTTVDGKVSANSTAISNLSTFVTNIDGRVTTQSDNITKLTSDYTNLVTKANANATAIDSLSTAVSVQGSNISSISSKVTALESSISDPTTGLSATANAVSSLSTRTETIDGKVTSAASRIDSLTTTVGNNTSTITNVSQSLNGVSVKFGVVGTINGQTGGFLFQGIQKLDGTVSYSVEIDGSLIVTESITSKQVVTSNLIVYSAQIKNLTVDNAQLANFAATQLASDVCVNERAPTAYINVRGSGRVNVRATYDGSPFAQYSLGTTVGELVIFRDDQAIVRSDLKFFLVDNRENRYNIIRSLSTLEHIDTPSPGVHKYTAAVGTTDGARFSLVVQENSK